MTNVEDKIRVGLVFSESDGPLYNHLKSIPKLHRGYELKKIIMGKKGDTDPELTDKDSVAFKKAQSGNSKVKETLKF